MNNLPIFIVFLLSALTAFDVAGRPLPSGESVNGNGCNVRDGRNVSMDAICKRLLICYQSKLLAGTGLSKLGRRFRPIKLNTNGSDELFAECAKIEGSEWHGLIIARIEHGKFTFASSLGFDGIFSTEQINNNGNITEFNLTKVFVPLLAEFRNALPFGPFLEDFGPIIWAFDFLPSSGQNDTRRLWKTKCIEPTVAPLAWHLDHLGTNCTQIAFPLKVDKFMLNITASPYEIACNKHQKRLTMDTDTSDWVTGEDQRLLNACTKVATTKCHENIDLFGCYKSIKNWPENNAIAKMCRKHLATDSNLIAGFTVRICIHREGKKLIVETLFSLSTVKEPLQLTRNFTISIDGISSIKHKMPIFFIEFGTDHRQSSIRLKDGETEIRGKWNEKDNGIGLVLRDIAPETINGTLMKTIHFMPPSNDDQMLAFFQIAMPKFTRLITNNTELKPFEHNPDKFNKPTKCDKYGDDCVPIKNLLLKIEALENCSKKDVVHLNESMFEIPNWAKPPPRDPYGHHLKPSESLMCDGDLRCNKERLQKQYNNIRKECGLKPENVEGKRWKRQYKPDTTTDGKWSKFPIMISFNKKNLPEKYSAWEEAIKTGADLIIRDTCVRFAFVEKMQSGDGIFIVKGYGRCGGSDSGRTGGWQELELAMDKTFCYRLHDMSVVAAHELLHALGLLHEQSRSDSRNFVLLRHNDEQSDVYNTQNFEFAYDFGSVMHYGATAHTHHTGLYNIITLPRFYQQTIGQESRISFKDAAIINTIYCNDSCKGHENNCKNGGYLSPNDCAKCLCPDGYGGANCELLEMNMNCVNVDSEARELEADHTAKVLKPTIKYGGLSRCHWKIKPKPGTKARIRFVELSDQLFVCEYNCSSSYVEIKYRADKRAQGAKLCCPDALRDPEENQYRNWIEAEKPDTDIIISAHLLTTNLTSSQKTVFGLTYEAGKVKLTRSCSCVDTENLFDAKRNPNIELECLFSDGTDCSCHGNKECLAQEIHCGGFQWSCPVLKINGVQVEGNLPKKAPHFWTELKLECLKAEGGSKGFWAYREDDNMDDPIRVDEIHCLDNVDKNEEE